MKVNYGKRRMFAFAIAFALAISSVSVNGGMSFQVQAADQSMKQEFDANKLYFIYSAYNEQNAETTGHNRVLFDTNGTIKFDNDFETTHGAKYRFRIQPDQTAEGSYFVKNADTKKTWTGNSSASSLTSAANASPAGGSYVFEVKERKDGKQYVAIRSNANNKYLAPNTNGTVTFTDKGSDRKNWWCVEEVVPLKGLEGTKLLWSGPMDNVFYRIPAITTANDGTMIAVSDARYNHTGDLGGGHRIDLLYRTSKDNGATWSEDKNLTNVQTAVGYGDAAIVADRESGKVLMVAANGADGFGSTGKKMRCGKMISTDNGMTFSKPVDIADQIYGLNESIQSFFCSSGRIMQSRYVKTGDYYRIYIAILAHDGQFGRKRNWVIYSDDFGESWSLLGDKENSPAPAGDEAKIEELPNGSVLISSRKGSGRYYNIFDYSDTSYKTGKWQKDKAVKLGNGRETNGEVGVVYARNVKTGEYTYLVLQSLPAGPNRSHVAIYYKELEEKDKTTDGFITGWSDDKRLMVQEKESAYSTWTMQPDGTVGFYWEESSCVYDMAYRSISIREITHGAYEAAFTGIGSKGTPYIVETQLQKKAMEGLYAKEGVSWDLLVDRLTEEKNQILNEVKNVYGEDPDKYTKDSWDAFITAYEKVKNAENLPAEEMRKLFDDLKLAYSRLKRNTVHQVPEQTEQTEQPQQTGKKLAAPENMKVTSSVKGIKVSYTKSADASGYEVYRKIASGSFRLLGTTKTENYVDTKPSPGKRNTYVVKAIGTGNFLTSDHSKEAEIKVPAQAEKLKVKGRKGGVLIQYGKLPSGCSLVVYRSTKKTSGFKKVKVLSRKYTSYLDKKGEKGKVYYKILVKKGKVYAPAQIKMTRVK